LIYKYFRDVILVVVVVVVVVVITVLPTLTAYNNSNSGYTST